MKAFIEDKDDKWSEIEDRSIVKDELKICIIVWSLVALGYYLGRILW